jgi:deazaflavin-dependent oxidoreductase (nitroreductase family)
MPRDARARKRQFLVVSARCTINPIVRLLFRLGVAPPTMTLVETTGRLSRARRRTPAMFHREGSVVWVIAQHGIHAGWVRNLQADPEVRLRLRRRWHHGTAELVPADDADARVRTFVRSPALGVLLAAAFRATQTTPASLRIELRPEIDEDRAHQ